MTKIVLSENVFKRMSTIYGVLKCTRCGGLLKVDDVIVSKKKQSIVPKMFDPNAFHSKSGFWRRSFYHEACWENMFIE